MRRVEVQTDQERPARSGVAIDFGHGAVAEQVREIANLVNLDIAIPEIIRVAARWTVFVREVIQRAATESVEAVIAAFQRPEIRQPAEVPFSDQRRAVAGGFEKRRQSRMVRWYADVAVAAAGQGLFQTDRKTVLIAPGDQGRAGGGAHRRVRIGLKQAHAAGGDAVDIRRLEIRPPVTRNVGVAHVVRHDVDDVGHRRGGRRGARTTRECERASTGQQQMPPRDLRLHSHVLPPRAMTKAMCRKPIKMSLALCENFLRPAGEGPSIRLVRKSS